MQINKYYKSTMTLLLTFAFRNYIQLAIKPEILVASKKNESFKDRRILGTKSKHSLSKQNSHVVDVCISRNYFMQCQLLHVCCTFMQAR